MKEEAVTQCGSGFFFPDRCQRKLYLHDWKVRRVRSQHFSDVGREAAINNCFLVMEKRILKRNWCMRNSLWTMDWGCPIYVSHIILCEKNESRKDQLRSEWFFNDHEILIFWFHKSQFKFDLHEMVLVQTKFPYSYNLTPFFVFNIQVPLLNVPG